MDWEATQWTDLIGYGEYRNVMILFHDPGVGVPFARCFFESEAAWESFRALVAGKLEVSNRVAAVKVGAVLLIVFKVLTVLLLVVLVILFNALSKYLQERL